MISKTNLQIDEQILKTDRVICRHISNMSNEGVKFSVSMGKNLL